MVGRQRGGRNIPQTLNDSELIKHYKFRACRDKVCDRSHERRNNTYITLLNGVLPLIWFD